MNILILSCGTRNKIVQYFKRELDGNGIVVATDTSELAPALYDADKYYIVSRIDQEGYLSNILSICKENSINIVFSLIDPELSILSKHKSEFLAIGTIPVVPDYEQVEMCFDKYAMYLFLVQNNIKTIKSFIDIDLFYNSLDKGEISFPVFVKPVKGSASININKVSTREEVELLFNKFNNLMIQEFITGTEYGADVYIDMITIEPVAIFLKEKIKMRAGETDKSVSIKETRLFDIIREFVKKANFKGIIDIDIFKSGDDYLISEVNPRFGGGYPHAYESGVNIPSMIIKNAEGKINKDVIGQYNEKIYMMKYNEVKIIQR
jgi:carbamoyl-phosphate synthase large subunit